MSFFVKRKPYACWAAVLLLLASLLACEGGDAPLNFGGINASGSALGNLPERQNIQVSVNGSTYTAEEIQSAITCYQDSSLERAQAQARIYQRLLGDSADDSDTLETAYYSVASQILDEQRDLTLNCL